VIFAVVGLVAAYVAIALLLLSLNLTSLWRWWIKAAAIIVTTVFFAVSYQTIHGLMGWPTAQRLPPRFNVVWTYVAEPNRKTKNPGAIYLWAEGLDENNVPSGRPRSYQLAYSDALARKIAAIQEKRERGVEVMGVVSDAKAPGNIVPVTDTKMGQMQISKGTQNPAADTVPFMDDGTRLGFQDLPPVLLPDKGPL
jgi:hypothetical protein